MATFRCNLCDTTVRACRSERQSCLRIKMCEVMTLSNTMLNFKKKDKTYRKHWTKHRPHETVTLARCDSSTTAHDMQDVKLAMQLHNAPWIVWFKKDLSLCLEEVGNICKAQKSKAIFNQGYQESDICLSSHTGEPQWKIPGWMYRNH